jgi:co-chaperonin GroES (HSP10)
MKLKVIHGDDIPPRVMIRKVDHVTKKKGSGMEVPPDMDEMPKAMVIQVPEPYQHIVSEGSLVYYMETREKGKVKHDDQEHNIVAIGQIVAIIEDGQVS